MSTTIDAPSVTNGTGHQPHDDTPPTEGVVEIYKPSSDALKGSFTAELRDKYGVKPETIIKAKDHFEISFWVWLEGDLWKCICGDWCFDMTFESGGPSREIRLSDFAEIAPDLMYRDWKGCRPGALHFHVTVKVPAGTIPAGDKNRTYDVVASFQMLDACGNPAAVVGHQELGRYQFYNVH
jgi:hypothetical protein